MGPTALVLMFLNRDTTHQFIILIYYLQCKIHSNLFTHIRTYPFIPVFLLVTYSFKYKRLVGSFTVQKYRNETTCSHQSPKNDPVANSSDFMDLVRLLSISYFSNFFLTNRSFDYLEFDFAVIRSYFYRIQTQLPPFLCDRDCQSKW